MGNRNKKGKKTNGSKGRSKSAAGKARPSKSTPKGKVTVATHKKPNRYSAIIEDVFLSKFKKGATEVAFERDEIKTVAAKLGIELPDNLGDLVYSFRYRAGLPEKIVEAAPKGKSWIIRPDGRSKYKFVAAAVTQILPNEALAQTKIPDATPGIIDMYALSDEQALLAKVRYNRLLDIFTGVTCYSLQSHLRTTVAGMGQVETDEIYVGLDRRGAQYVLPVQAKGGNDKLSIVQIEQDFGLCMEKFPNLISKPVAAQFMDDNLIALFAFEESETGIALAMEKHYLLVPPEELTDADLETYRKRKLEE